MMRMAARTLFVLCVYRSEVNHYGLRRVQCRVTGGNLKASEASYT